MNVNLQGLRGKTVPISQYMETLTEPFKDKFLARKQTYQLKTEVTNQLKKFANKYVIIAFSAEWCKDCASNIPILALISRTTGIEVRVFGGLKKDPLNPDRKWRIPPSPPEVEAFHVDKIPLILLYNNEGEEIGRIIENPEEPTLEEELLKILSTRACS